MSTKRFLTNSEKTFYDYRRKEQEAIEQENREGLGLHGSSFNI